MELLYGPLTDDFDIPHLVNAVVGDVFFLWVYGDAGAVTDIDWGGTFATLEVDDSGLQLWVLKIPNTGRELLTYTTPGGAWVSAPWILRAANNVTLDGTPATATGFGTAIDSGAVSGANGQWCLITGGVGSPSFDLLGATTWDPPFLEADDNPNSNSVDRCIQSNARLVWTVEPAAAKLTAVNPFGWVVGAANYSFDG